MFDIAGVLERGFGPLDEQEALQLARAMFPGAEKDLASFLDDLRHGRWPRVVIRAHMPAALLHRHFAVCLILGLVSDHDMSLIATWARELKPIASQRETNAKANY